MDTAASSTSSASTPPGSAPAVPDPAPRPLARKSSGPVPPASAAFRRGLAGDGKARDPHALRRLIEEQEEDLRRRQAEVREARAAHMRRLRTARDSTFAGTVLRPLHRAFAQRVGEDEAAIEAGLAAATEALADKAVIDRALALLRVPSAPKASASD